METSYNYQYMLALEASRLDCEFLYAVASINNKVIGVSLATVWKLRFPYKLSFKVTTMGTPVNLGLALMIRPNVNNDELRKQLIGALESESVKRGIRIFVGRDFPSADYLSGVRLEKLYDCAFLKLEWADFEQYLAQHPKRKSIRRDIRSLDKAGYRLEIREGSVLSDEEGQRLYELWLQLYHKYNSPDQIDLTKEFFIQTSKLENSVFLLLYNQDEKIIAFDACFVVGDCLESTYCGVDLHFTGRLPVHKIMGHHIIRYALNKGFSHINFGTSNEKNKVDMGCYLLTYYTWISIVPKWLNILIRPILYRFIL